MLDLCACAGMGLVRGREAGGGMRAVHARMCICVRERRVCYACGPGLGPGAGAEERRPWPMSSGLCPFAVRAWPPRPPPGSQSQVSLRARASLTDVALRGPSFLRPGHQQLLGGQRAGVSGGP